MKTPLILLGFVVAAIAASKLAGSKRDQMSRFAQKMMEH
jgi:hypothetical protein